eukprot:138172-Chlamydomonas_euryale.AAC.1
MGSDERKTRIASTGAIELLVALLKPGAGASAEAQRQAACAFKNLALGSSAVTARIASAGAIEVLVALLKPGSGANASTQEHAAGVLKNLACGSDEHKARIASVGEGISAVAAAMGAVCT